MPAVLAEFCFTKFTTARPNVEIPYGFSLFCAVLAEFSAVLVENSASTADFLPFVCQISPLFLI